MNSIEHYLNAGVHSWRKSDCWEMAGGGWDTPLHPAKGEVLAGWALDLDEAAILTNVLKHSLVNQGLRTEAQGSRCRATCFKGTEITPE